MRSRTRRLLAVLPIPLLLLTYFSLPDQTSPSSLELSLKVCNSSTGVERYDCETLAMIEATGTQSPPLVMAALIALAKQDVAVASDCHELGHTFGLWAYKNFQQAAVGPGLGDCLYGYYHGLLEGAAAVTPATELAAVETSLCTSFTPRQDEECVHGIGHAISDIYDDFATVLELCSAIGIPGRVPDCFSGASMNWSAGHVGTDPSAAVLRCERATASLELLNVCTQGVLMYSQLGESSNRKLLALCATLDPTRQGSCYSALGDAAINPGEQGEVPNPQLAAILYERTCGNVPPRIGPTGCAISFASSYLSLTQSTQLAEKLCSIVSTYRYDCRLGIKQALDIIGDDSALHD